MIPLFVSFGRCDEYEISQLALSPPRVLKRNFVPTHVAN